MCDDLGQCPKWRWDEILDFSKKTYELEFDISYTDLFYDLILVPSYTVNRYYHNLRHVECMLKYANGFEVMSLYNRNLLKWAIWFHDIVYDPKRNDNEAESVIVMTDFMNCIGMSQENIESMKWMIMLTSLKGSPQTQSEDIMCDLDLRELGTDRYFKSRDEVRLEYSHLSDEEFNIGRLSFLNSILERDFIYQTRLYRETLEEKARDNIKKEIQLITHGKNVSNIRMGT